MRFTKMQGAGNDYIYVNCFEERVADPASVSRFVSDRHFGIGSDGLILIKPNSEADFEMEMYNADGSKGAMCGNGIRCVGKYVYDNGLTKSTRIRVATGSGIRTLDLHVEDGKVNEVTVEMGAPAFEASRIPVITDLPRVIDAPLLIGGEERRVTCVSMGNPHCVTQVDDVDGLDIASVGPVFENAPIFPDRVNTEFIRVLDRQNVQMRVWERGSGETLACGTGACAVAAACMQNGWTDDEVNVHLRGGVLQISWNRAENMIYMRGPAVKVFDGDIDL